MSDMSITVIYHGMSLTVLYHKSFFSLSCQMVSIIVHGE